MGVVLLVRHGQASFGADDYDVLSETGWEQSRLLGAWLAERKVDARRGAARRHAPAPRDRRGDGRRRWLGHGHRGRRRLERVRPPRRRGGVAPIGSGPDLPADRQPDRDLDRRAFQRVFELAITRWTGGEYDGEYAESYAAFVARVRVALDRACEAAGPGGTVVVVTSGGPIAAACAALVDPTGEDPATLARLWARFNTVTVNSSVTRIVVGSTGARMLTFNEHAHLEGETLTYR